MRLLRFRWRFVGAVCAALACCLAPGTAFAGRYQTTLSGGNHVFTPASIPVSKSSQIHVYARCFDTKIGKNVADKVQLFIVAGPNKSKFTGPIPSLVTASSNPTTWPLATLQTSDETTPGVFSGSSDTVVRFRGVGARCGAYAVNTSSTGALTVAPKLKAKGSYWWLNGNQDENKDYQETVKLTAFPKGLSYTWSFYYGEFDSKYALFKSGKKQGAELKTNGNEASLVDHLLAWDPDPAAKDFYSLTDYPFGKRTIPVTVTVNGARSAPVYVSFRFPAAIELLTPRQVEKKTGVLPSGNPLDQHDPLFGHKTTIWYRVLDQNGDVLPKPIWLRENFFDTAYQYRPDVLPNNWKIGQEGDKPGPKQSDPELVKDGITGQSAFKATPLAQGPHKPLQFVDMGYWRGSITVGSVVKYRGVLVALLNWQKFRDHARHCDLRSPPNEDAQFPCPKGAP